MRITGLIILSIGIAGCVSAPAPHYYTVDMASPTPITPKYNIQVDRLRPNEAITRNEIMIKKSSTEVEYYALDRWVAGLGELVPEKLRTDFGEHKDGRETVVISGDILAFEQVDTPDGATGHIRMAIGFRPIGESRYDKPLLEKTYDALVPAKSSGPKAAVEALSRGLDKLASEIAADADSLVLPVPAAHK